MAMTNGEVARILERIGLILELRGENIFKARSYYNAARMVANLGEDINKVVADDRLKDLPGIGETLNFKIGQLVTTGRMEYLEEIKEGIPDGLLTMLDIPDIGPKKARLLYDKLGVKSIDELEAAAKAGRIAELAGMGEKSQQKILTRIEQYRKHRSRRLLSEALPLAESVLAAVQKIPGVTRASLAGSIRRHVETIGDIDVLASGDDRAAIVEAFTKLPGVEDVIGAGPTKGSVVFSPGIHSDLRVVSDGEFAAALHYFTGSKDHNVRMRQMAKDRGWKLSEYGLFEGEKAFDTRGEAELFGLFNMDWIEPELRENTGEIEAAAEHKLPTLLEENDVRGLVHVHSDWSDGSLPIAKVIETARAHGWSYMTLTDHSRAVRVANGLDEARVREQWKELEKARRGAGRFTVFSGGEVDILKDGSLDHPDALLAEMDCVIAAVHSGFGMPADEMTARIVKAVSNPRVDVLAHPTGRLLLEREPYAVDVDKVVAACVEHGVAIEIDGHPSRLDLDWRYIREAKRLGARFVISLDAHSVRDFDNLPYGVYNARKGWLEKKDVLNTMTAREFQKWLASRATRALSGSSAAGPRKPARRG